ncbi:hypothetical protein F511_37142 [Dorcoceras hygrometricum]|uniref:Uncharacterized protein n=1 Tax=Dorcoceras hygrometricum TaxID=472368 RepID=A0A2Z7BFC2_9LAMI|nr:hypothetical protein F511_37142 [Dorcoceras hygrometricum]
MNSEQLKLRKYHMNSEMPTLRKYHMNSEQLTLRKYHMNSEQLNTTNATAGCEQMQQLVTNKCNSWLRTNQESDLLALTHEKHETQQVLAASLLKHRSEDGSLTSLKAQGCLRKGGVGYLARFLVKSTLVKVTVARAGEFCSSSDVVSVTYEDLLVLVRVEVAAAFALFWLLLISRRACAKALKRRRLNKWKRCVLSFAFERLAVGSFAYEKEKIAADRPLLNSSIDFSESAGENLRSIYRSVDRHLDYLSQLFLIFFSKPLTNYCSPRHFFPRFTSHPAFVFGYLCGAEFPLLSPFVCYPFEKLNCAGSGNAKPLDFEVFEESLCVRSSASVSFWVSNSCVLSSVFSSLSLRRSVEFGIASGSRVNMIMI